MKHLTRLSLTSLVFVAQLATGGGLWTPASTASHGASPSLRPAMVDAFPVAEAQFATQRPLGPVGAPS